jgi:OmpA-OmpF porin, OOP family
MKKLLIIMLVLSMQPQYAFAQSADSAINVLMQILGSASSDSGSTNNEMNQLMKLFGGASNELSDVQNPAIASNKRAVSTYKASNYEPTFFATNTTEADVEYRYGDIDNLNQGWPYGYDPFSGDDSEPHSYPFGPSKTDPQGTDKIMVGTGYKGDDHNVITDGYTGTSSRAVNKPLELLLNWPKTSHSIKSISLQMFVDDFQPHDFKKHYEVTIDGEAMPQIANVINSLQQSGPIGKLITIDILPEYFKLFSDNKVAILIDDAYTKNGDGYAIDFVRLLINPKIKGKGHVQGIVVNKSGKAIAGSLVSASSGSSGVTNANGEFLLSAVANGLAIITASHEQYKSNSAKCDVSTNKQQGSLKIVLESASSKDLAETLNTMGQIDLQEILFDVASANLKPESEAILQQLAFYIQKNISQKISIIGHTDNDGDATKNLKLSKQRAEAVVTWLAKHQCKVNNISTWGLGDTKPIANNDTPQGKRLNRRVEIKLDN